MDAERAYALTRSAQARRNAGASELAASDQREAVALYRELGDRARLCHALRHLGDILLEAGRPAEAVPLYAEMIAAYRAEPDTPPLEMANALRSLALHAEGGEDGEAARGLWVEARDRYQELGIAAGVREASARLKRLASRDP